MGVHGEHRAPELPVVGSGLCAGAGHPAEAGQCVGLGAEALPLGSLVGTAHGGVVLGAQPVAALVVGYRPNVVRPLFEGFFRVSPKNRLQFPFLLFLDYRLNKLRIIIEI